MEWALFYGSAVGCGLAAVAIIAAVHLRGPKPSPEEVPAVQPLDLSLTVELLRDVANYLAADASKGGNDYRYKLEIEAKRLTGGK